MEIQELKQFLPEYAERTLQKAEKGYYVCPYCGSGHKRNRTAALKVYKDGWFKCFSCGEYGDIFNLIGQVENKTFIESMYRAQEMFGGCEVKPIQEKPTRKTNVRYKYKDYIEGCAKNVNKAKDYLKKRGFTSKDAKRFNLGYDIENDAIVIPYGKTCSYFIRRSVKGKSFYKPPGAEAGPEPIYNVAALKEDKPCFVCESPIDAISVMVASEYNAVAIGGTGIKKLLDYIDANKIKAPIIVSLDDDEDKERNAGLESAKVLMGELAGRRIPYAFAKYSKDQYPKTQRKDANDMLNSRREIFENDLKTNARKVELIRYFMTNDFI